MTGETDNAVAALLAASSMLRGEVQHLALMSESPLDPVTLMRRMMDDVMTLLRSAGTTVERSLDSRVVSMGNQLRTVEDIRATLSAEMTSLVILANGLAEDIETEARRLSASGQ